MATDPNRPVVFCNNRQTFAMKNSILANTPANLRSSVKLQWRNPHPAIIDFRVRDDAGVPLAVDRKIRTAYVAKGCRQFDALVKALEDAKWVEDVQVIDVGEDSSPPGAEALKEMNKAGVVDAYVRTFGRAPEKTATKEDMVNAIMEADLN